MIRYVVWIFGHLSGDCLIRGPYIQNTFETNFLMSFPLYLRTSKSWPGEVIIVDTSFLLCPYCKLRVFLMRMSCCSVWHFVDSFSHTVKFHSLNLIHFVHRTLPKKKWFPRWFFKMSQCLADVIALVWCAESATGNTRRGCLICNRLQKKCWPFI